MPGGPQPVDHTTRMALVQEFAERARQVHEEKLLATGLYGSLARGCDGPYLDIEIICVLIGFRETFRGS